VSRTPVRGALQRLQQEGYVVDPSGGRLARPTVAPLTSEDARELFHIVAELEGLAARGAAELAPAPRRALRRPPTLPITGRLSPARGNELVTVSALPPGATRWQHQTVRTGATGAFTTSWRLRRGTTRLVAQWPGDFASTGDGSAVLSVRVGGR
jgi:hypothetical protein